MALTFQRWIIACVAGCLAAAALALSLRLSGRDFKPTKLDQLQAENWRTTRTTVVAANRLRTLVVVDSVSRSFEREPAAAARLRIQANLPLDTREKIAGAVALVARQRTTTPRTPVDVAFIADTPRKVRTRQVGRFGLVVSHRIPDKPGDRCLVVARLGSAIRYGQWYFGAGSPTISQLMGPCQYYETYGLPGKEIDRWLRAGGWRYGRMWVDSLGTPAFRVTRDNNGATSSLWKQEAGFPLRYYLPPTAYKCASGSHTTCLEVFERSTFSPLRTIGGNIWSVSVTDWDDETYGERDLGARTGFFLSDMARTIGRDRFQKFWTSDRPLADAFHDATGEDLGAWTSAWAKRAYGELTVGPQLAGMQGLSGLAFAALGLVAAIVVAARRQIS